MLVFQKQNAVAYRIESMEVPNFTAQKSKAQRAMLLGCLVLVALAVCPIYIYAANDEILQIFSSEAFQGSMEVVNSMSLLGKIMNFIISIFCLIGLLLVMYSRMITLLYLSSRNVWDEVASVKTHMTGSFFGFKDFGKYVFNESGGGLDSFVSFFYGLLPNVKKYSDYNDKIKASLKLDDSDTALDYILKVGPSTIMVMFFLTLGFSGLLSEAYGKIVSVMVRFADNVISVNFEGYVDKLFDLGSAPDFSLSNDGTTKGKTLGKVAKSVYSYAASAANVEDTSARASLSAAAEDLISNRLTEASVTAAINAGNGGGNFAINSDSDWGSVKAVVSRKTTATAAESTIVISIQELIPSYEGEVYFHIALSSNGSGKNYFQTTE